MFGSWVLNEIWIIDLSSSLVGMLMSPSELFLFSNEAHLTVTVFVTALCFSHHACCLLYIWTKLTVAFTFTSFPFNLYRLVLSDVVVVSDLNKNFGGSTDLAKKGHGSADLHTPIHPAL